MQRRVHKRQATRRSYLSLLDAGTRRTPHRIWVRFWINNNNRTLTGIRHRLRPWTHTRPGPRKRHVTGPEPRQCCRERSKRRHLVSNRSFDDRRQWVLFGCRHRFRHRIRSIGSRRELRLRPPLIRLRCPRYSLPHLDDRPTAYRIAERVSIVFYQRPSNFLVGRSRQSQRSTCLSAKSARILI